MLLPNPSFLEWLLDVIKNAKKTIVIVNYMAALSEDDKNGPVARIVCALAEAVKRGIQVQIILEGNKLQENYNFWRVLKSYGADVWLDTSVTFLHTKAVLIDDRKLCIGSHNITSAALTRHEELSLATSDPSAISCFKREHEKYTAQRHEIGDASKKGVLLPATVVQPLIKIKRSAAFRAYSIYLLLCRLDRGVPKSLSVDTQSWVEMLKIPTYDWGAGARMKQLLEFMDKNLGIVQFDEQRGTVKRTAVPKSMERILLPDSFWDFGWYRRLSMEAVHLYIAGEAERQSSPYAPWWRLKRDQLAKKYGFQKQLVNRAQRELMRYDLMEVLFETATSEYKLHIRYMNYFRQNPFYDYDGRRRQIEEISKHYSESVFSIVQKIARKLNFDMSVEKIAALCRYTKECGEKRARWVLKTISGLSPNSSKLTFTYTEELFGKKVQYN
jgi:HKD family nuclease